MATILTIEDNVNFRDSASRYFNTLSGVNADFAYDFETSVRLLKDTRYDGVISDVFFPRITGSLDTSLGIKAVRMMAETDSNHLLSQDIIREVGKYAKIDDELTSILRKFSQNVRNINEFRESSLVKAIVQVSKLFGNEPDEGTALIIKNTLGLMYGNDSKYKDYYGTLEKSMEEDETNQPLGVLVGEKCDELRIPFVLATSGYHHDILLQPVCDYANKNNWRLIDCSRDNPNEKLQLGFWDKVYKQLSERMN